MTGKETRDFLRKLDRVDQTGQRVMSRGVVILYVIFTCFTLGATIYYGVRGFRGNGDTKQFVICGTILLILAAFFVCNQLIDLFFKNISQKNSAIDLRTMELPAQGSVTLEDALHKMSAQTAVIVWDTLLGCVVFSLLCMLAFGLGDTPRILLLCIGITACIAAGHVFFHFLWKRKSFTKKMLNNTAKAIGLKQPEAYAAAVEQSLKKGVLAYEKGLILTEEYILGCAEWDTYYTPVAIPREQVEELIFFYRRMVGGKNSRTVGILRCNADGKKLVDLVLGPSLKAERIKRILDFYQIPWREEELAYI